MGKVKIFCDCGKEIWTGLDEVAKRSWSLWGMEKEAVCSDCFLAKIQRKIQRPDEEDVPAKQGG